jgi:hypothetical protein
MIGLPAVIVVGPVTVTTTFAAGTTVTVALAVLLPGTLSFVELEIFPVKVKVFIVATVGTVTVYAGVLLPTVKLGIVGNVTIPVPEL